MKQNSFAKDPCQQDHDGKKHPLALVTGASGGIGSATAKALARAGCDLILHYAHHEEKARTLGEELQACRVLQADFSREQELEAFLEQVEEIARSEGLDILVNNAGISDWGLFCDLSEARRQEIMQVNLSAGWRLCRAVMPAMLSHHHGSIVNVASIWGLHGASCEVAYSVSKAAIIGLTRSLAAECGPSGVRVNAVAPGVIETEMLRDFGSEELKDLAERTPLERLGRPEEVAAAIRFLALEEASFITGQCLTVDGGFTL